MYIYIYIYIYICMYIYIYNVYVSGNPAHEKEIRRRIGMGWSAFGKHKLVMNRNLPLSLKRNL